MKEELKKITNVGALSVRNTKKNLPNCAPKREKGITLVALIITIIVLLILAVVAIRAVQGDGIISKAKDARDKYEEAQTNEQDKLLELEYQIAKEQGTVTGTYNDYLFENKYGFKIGTKVAYEEGNATYAMKDNGSIGKEHNGYNTLGGTFITEDLEWRVLGENENGQIELISNKPTSLANGVCLDGDPGLMDTTDLRKHFDLYCSTLYGTGVGASSARSLNLDDVNKLANYNPIKNAEYGKIWTYKFHYDEDDYSNTGFSISNDGGVTWIDKHDCYPLATDTSLHGPDSTRDGLVSTRTYTYYSYTLSDEIKGSWEDGTVISDFITKGEENSEYIEQWLGDVLNWCGFTGNISEWRPMYMSDNILKGAYMEEYFPHSDHKVRTIRPVVTLSAIAKLVDTNNDGILEIEV